MAPFSSPYFIANHEEYQGYHKIQLGKDQVFLANERYAYYIIGIHREIEGKVT
jgi:hypothetical protein